jgi:hypothetical protein
MVKARKRRPGAGRKPKGVIHGKTETFSTRITPGTREALEREVAASGHSISQVAERLLVLGLEAKRLRSSNKAIRALCFVIERIAREVTGGTWINPTAPESNKSPGHRESVERLLDEWRTDPFRYRTFKLAVGSLLTALEPKGEIRSPFATELIDSIVKDDPAMNELMKRTYESPENLAAYIFSNIWRDINRDYPLSEKEKREVGYGRGPVGEMMLADFYQMSDARHDLGIKLLGEKS